MAKNPMLYQDLKDYIGHYDSTVDGLIDKISGIDKIIAISCSDYDYDHDSIGATIYFENGAGVDIYKHLKNQEVYEERYDIESTLVGYKVSAFITLEDGKRAEVDYANFYGDNMTNGKMFQFVEGVSAPEYVSEAYSQIYKNSIYAEEISNAMGHRIDKLEELLFESRDFRYDMSGEPKTLDFQFRNGNGVEIISQHDPINMEETVTVRPYVWEGENVLDSGRGKTYLVDDSHSFVFSEDGGVKDSRTQFTMNQYIQALGLERMDLVVGDREPIVEPVEFYIADAYTDRGHVYNISPIGSTFVANYLDSISELENMGYNTSQGSASINEPNGANISIQINDETLLPQITMSHPEAVNGDGQKIYGTIQYDISPPTMHQFFEQVDTLLKDVETLKSLSTEEMSEFVEKIKDENEHGRVVDISDLVHEYQAENDNSGPSFDLE